MASDKEPWGKNVLVEFEDKIAWVTLNRPEKRNAMSPTLERRDGEGDGGARSGRRAAACWC